MLIFQNPGLIDIRAATTMGINAKADASAIGFFGTGLKYSIACILRWGGKITIWRGLEAFEFTSQDCSVRDKGFSIVCMNGRELGFVTDYGKKWEPWQVYRELFTNCQDEGGKVFVADEPWQAEGVTTVVVDCEQIFEAYGKRSTFILEGSPDFTGSACALFDRQSSAIFYQRLCVSRTPREMLFTYDLRRKTGLTEDRTLACSWDFDIALTILVDELCQSPIHRHHEMAKAIMLAPRGTWEQQAHFGLTTGSERSPQFWAMAQHLMRHQAFDLNNSIKELLGKRKPMVESIEIFQPSELQKAVLDRASEFASRIGFDVTAYPIICAERLGDGILGLAHEGTIFITREAFDMGTKMVAGTLIEEFIHLREGVKDCTRKMQNFLLNRLVTLGEEHVCKVPL